MQLTSRSACALALALALSACGSDPKSGPPASDPPASTPAVTRFTRPLDPELLQQFVTPLPIIPARTPDTTSAPGTDFYVVTAKQGVHDFGLRSWTARDPRPLRRKAIGTRRGATTPATSARPSRRAGPPGGREVRERPRGRGRTPSPAPVLRRPHLRRRPGQPALRVVPHLHGGHVSAEFDGNPLYWFRADPAACRTAWAGRPATASTTPTRTISRRRRSGSTTTRSASPRLNVYAGLAAFYLLRDARRTRWTAARQVRGAARAPGQVLQRRRLARLPSPCRS